MKIPVRGPGRPKKWDKPLRQWRADIPEDDYDFIEDTRTRLGLSRAEFLHMILHQANVNLLELQAKIKHLEEALNQLEKEKQALLEEREKLLDRIEKLQLQIQALKLGSKTVVRDAIKLKAIAEKIEEGKSWKEVCALAGFRDEDKIRDYLKLAFNIRKNDRDEWPEVFKPKDIVEEFQGWVLVKPSEKADIISYVFVRKGREKAFLKEQKLKAEPEKALEVSDAAAEITKVLKDWLEGYELALMDKHGKERAERMAKDFQRFALKRLIDKYGFTAVFDVVYSDPHFKRVILPLLEPYAPKEVLEVKT
ncbi:MAG: hypothetical protein H0Z18_08135 [Thermococcus sp.]|uniref:hypothetical protein n=1 Tax=Thermococcus sp. TaxID=35749 RepID=UPI001D99692E|nr:hypothetical protein [Thermococcus sp.]MBO8175212.1 hypothetical protein [Thermococcus sp.]